MEKGGLTRSACLIAVVGAAAIAIIGFSTWRYDVALSRAAVALNERADATTTTGLTPLSGMNARRPAATSLPRGQRCCVP
jgi:hypothetical protein